MFKFKFYQFLENGYLPGRISYSEKQLLLQKRRISFLIEWFTSVFNMVDKERVKLVGPECACAEWLLRNGASVRFKGHKEKLSDYNELIKLEESPELKTLKVEEIYAWEAGLNYLGFDHLKDCTDIKKISFIFCNRLNDLALYKLKFVQHTLEYLEIKSCFNIGDKGIKSLVQLRNLNTLILADLVSLKKKDECDAVLREALPRCKIDFR